jgi:hypothetical protein
MRKAHRLAGEQRLQPEALALTVAADQVALRIVRLDGAAPQQVQRLVAVADFQQHRALAPVDRLDGSSGPVPQRVVEQVKGRSLGEKVFDVGQRIVHGHPY